MEVRPGYKQTEAGVLPLDWQVSSIGELFDVRAGGDFDARRSSVVRDENYPYPIYSNAITNAGLYGYCTYNDHASASITVTARGTLGVANYRDHDFTAIGRVLVLQPKRECDGRYFAEVMNNRINFVVESTGVPQLTAPQISKYKLPVPPAAEQRAIAAALSDVDALIARLDQLIAKKRDLKQATMQQLLTGKTRLPGFKGGWWVKRLGDIAHIKTGSRNNQDKVDDGEYPFFVRSANVERINSFSHDCEAILVPGEGGIGSIFHYIKGRFDVHQRVYAITQFAEGVSGKYVHLYMTVSFGPHAMQNSVKATVDSLRLPTFQEFPVSLPPTLDEQTAIATALFDFDTEIAAIEARRDKTLLLGQGMMQELLTGKIRVI